MFREPFYKLRREFTKGRNTKPAGHYYAGWVETEHFGVVSIPDVLPLHHKASRTTGILTHIGGNAIGIRNDNGDLIEGEYSRFCFVDDQGLPLGDIVKDRIGQVIKPGDYVAFGRKGGMGIGRISKFTPIGTVMIDTPSSGRKWLSREKVDGGSGCLLLDQDNPHVLIVKTAIDETKET